MNPRDARLFPRLIEVLNTADNERELGMAVLQIRRILATEGKQLTDLLKPTPPSNLFNLNDDRQPVAVAIRELGGLLRFARHRLPETNALLGKMALALQMLGHVTHEDLRMLLSCISELIQVKINAEQERRPFVQPDNTPYGGFRQGSPFASTSYTSTSRSFTHDTMDELRDRMRETMAKNFRDATRREGGG